MESAVKNLLVLAKQYKGIIELIPFLEEIKSLELYKAELTSQISVLEKQKEETQDSFETRKKYYEDELLATAEEVEKANSELIHLKKNNSGLTKSMIENAKERADSIVADAEAKKLTVEEAIVSKRAELAEVVKEFNATFEKTKVLKDQLMDLRKKLDL